MVDRVSLVIFFLVADCCLLNNTDRSTQSTRLVTSPKYVLHFLFRMLITLNNFFWGGSLQTPSTFSMLILPTHLLSTFTMPATRIGLCSRSYRAHLTLPTSPPFWTMIPMCFVSLFFLFVSKSVTHAGHVGLSRVSGLAHSSTFSRNNH